LGGFIVTKGEVIASLNVQLGGEGVSRISLQKTLILIRGGLSFPGKGGGGVGYQRGRGYYARLGKKAS